MSLFHCCQFKNDFSRIALRYLRLSNANMAPGESFIKWLNTKLRELKTDENIYGSYIIGILEGDELIEEKKEALEEILSQIIEDDIQNVLQTIIEKWEQFNAKVEETPKIVEDVDTKLAKLMESKRIATTVTRQQYTPEQQRIREQILAQYSQVELDECEDDDDVGGPTASSDSILMKNTNASDVAQLAKERREQAKLDSKAKKDKDKEDREKQKQLREEKKEKRKTVKGERRR